MRISFRKNKLHLLLMASMSLTLAACNEDDDNFVPPPTATPAPAPAPAPVPVTYEVTVTNLTNAQPLSPVAVVLHQEGNLWTLGESATVELEQMAEAGDNSGLLTLPVVLAGASGAAPVGPGASETIMVTIDDITTANLSVATMLVNTNDAFTGVNAFDLSNMEVGDTYMRVTHVYDAGTEANSEALGTIPGPADGSDGAGFAEARDDVDIVAGHPGVVGEDGGLMGSVLNNQHKFDNPAMRVRITRVE